MNDRICGSLWFNAPSHALVEQLSFGRTSVADLLFAFGAFVDVPMRPRMAYIAVPEDEGCV